MSRLEDGSVALAPPEAKFSESSESDTIRNGSSRSDFGFSISGSNAMS